MMYECRVCGWKYDPSLWDDFTLVPVHNYPRCIGSLASPIINRAAPPAADKDVGRFKWHTLEDISRSTGLMPTWLQQVSQLAARIEAMDHELKANILLTGKPMVDAIVSRVTKLEGNSESEASSISQIHERIDDCLEQIRELRQSGKPSILDHGPLAEMWEAAVNGMHANANYYDPCHTQAEHSKMQQRWVTVRDKYALVLGKDK